MTKPTLTIGIPAYNEAAAITGLLADLRHQTPSNYTLDAIVVVSDASTDATDALVKAFSLPKLRLLRRKHRGGKAAAMNQLRRLSHSDILIILDADIRLPDVHFISHLVQPVITSQADLVAANEQILPATTRFGQILAVSHSIKHAVFSHYHQGENFFTCHGQARAFSRRLYQHLDFPFSAGEDLYSFVFCHVHGYRYRFASKAKVIFRLPQTYADHERQSIRFAHAMSRIQTQFGSQSLRELTTIPWPHVIYWTCRYFLHAPIPVLLNLAIFGAARLRSLIVKSPLNNWSMVTSSKKLS